MTDTSSQDVIETHGDQHFFWCPGCQSHHAPNNRWTWNGDRVKPTFHPSVLSQGVRDAACAPTPQRCHLFVRDGKLQYLSDCTHELAGQTVEMRPMCELWAGADNGAP